MATVGRALAAIGCFALLAWAFVIAAYFVVAMLVAVGGWATVGGVVVIAIGVIVAGSFFIWEEEENVTPEGD